MNLLKNFPGCPSNFPFPLFLHCHCLDSDPLHYLSGLSKHALPTKAFLKADYTLESPGSI